MDDAPTATVPELQHLVLVGGGHSHVIVLRSLGMRPIPGVKVTLITKDVHTPYSGMLPGLVAGHYTFDETHIDLRPLARFARADLVHGRVQGINREKQRVEIADGRPPIQYDFLSINVGISPNLTSVSGAEMYATPVKPIDRFAERWEQILQRFQKTRAVDLVLVGGGAGGVELALAVHYRLHREVEAARIENDSHIAVSLVTKNELLESHNSKVRSIFRRVLRERNIQLYENAPVRIVDGSAKKLHVQSAENPHLEIQYTELLWCTQADAPSWISQSDLPAINPGGFIHIEPTLAVPGTGEKIFAAGDCASCPQYPRPKAGVFAVRQGPILYRNLRSAIIGKPLLRYVPQSSFLGLISTGDKYAIASRSWYLALEGNYLWNIKDYIDRTFMKKFNDLPEMKVLSIEEKLNKSNIFKGPLIRGVELLGNDPMRCGGCGSKVTSLQISILEPGQIGGDTLSRVLQRLKRLYPSTIGNLDDDCAVLPLPSLSPKGGISPDRNVKLNSYRLLQSVDFFRSFINDPFTFGKIAAIHSLSDLHAMGVAGSTATAVALVPHGADRRVEEDLFQMLAGACDTMREEGCVLVGGHSAESSETAFGLCVSSIVVNTQIRYKGGIRPGDALVLTKALGTGIVLAGDMRSKAKSRWVEAAITSMLTSNLTAALTINESKRQCSALTDVTGFGLVGHLLEMITASHGQLRVELMIEKIPILPGAAQLATHGVHSSLYAQNSRLKSRISNFTDIEENDIVPILFDPQTAGGLLAAVSSNVASDLVVTLKNLGYVDCSIIGRCIAIEESDSANQPIFIY